MSSIITRWRWQCASALAVLYAAIKPETEVERAAEVLHLAFDAQGGGDGDWRLDATLRDPAFKFVTFAIMQALGDAPNHMTGGASLKCGNRGDVYEVTIQRCGGGYLTPADRIGQLLDALRALRDEASQATPLYRREAEFEAAIRRADELLTPPDASAEVES